MNQYATITAYFEYGHSGFIRPWGKIRDVSFPGVVSGTPTFSEGIVILFHTYLLGWLVLEICFHMRTAMYIWVLYENVFHYLTIWNGVIYLSIATYTHLFQFWYTARNVLSIPSTDVEQLHDMFQILSYLSEAYWNFYAVTVFICWLRCFRLMEHVPRLCMLTQTVRNASGELFSVCLILLVLLNGYGIMGLVLYGDRLAR